MPAVLVPCAYLKNLWLFPMLIAAKALGIRVVYWGHGRDLQDKRNHLKNMAYIVEHFMVDGIILYAEHLKQYVPRCLHQKVFIANNTLDTSLYDNVLLDREATKAKYGIKTSRNIICMGRFESRKRVQDLVGAFKGLRRDDVGLVLAGPDSDGLLQSIEHPRIYKTGAVYGEAAIQLLSACDVYCLPGAVGLSIVDAFYCGLPLVTEEGIDHGPEIMYLKPGVNGFMVPKGDTQALAEKLELLLHDDQLRQQFSRNARREIATNGHISTFAKGFLAALDYVSGVDRGGPQQVDVVKTGNLDKCG
jgi:glycosyltransferase involved in cell wall biosynthesis